MFCGVGVTVTTETYTSTELDQFVGAALWMGRLHNCLASFLDTTRFDEDPGLIEYMNHMPVELVMEILPATTLLVAEVKTRAEEILRAIAVAEDSAAARVIEEGTRSETADEFAKIMYVEFGKDRKKNGK